MKSQILLLVLTAALCSLGTSSCLIYSTPNQCSQCAIGYYLTTNFSCLPCPQGCIQCLSSSLCTNCTFNYFLSSNLCEQGPNNCLLVNNNGSCLECLIGFYIDGIDCTACPSYCANCNNQGCLNCSFGFGLNSSSGNCFVCNSNCSSCGWSTFQSTAYCTSCLIGNYIVDGFCLPCSDACVYCGVSGC